MSTSSCGCCACLAGARGPAGVVNRPGLSAIRYRTGTYASLFEAMVRRLTLPVDPLQPAATYSLHRLTTREGDDPAIALLDAWAIVGDILTFYQERIANEAFLRTATERRSVLELGRLVGYTLKPGVSASVYLAYTLDDTATTIIPVGTKAQSIPGVNEQPQTFETSEDTEARGAWNALRPRMRRPQDITIDNVLTVPSLWIDGTTTRLDIRDALLFAFDIGKPAPAALEEERRPAMYAMRRTLKTNIDLERKRTEIVLEPVRPYYPLLAGVVRAEISRTAAPLPPSRPASRKKAAAAEPPAFSKLELFLQQILLGVPRTVLQVIAVEQELGDTVIEATLLEDVDPPATVPGGGPRTIEELLRPLVKPRGIAPASQWQFGRSLTQSLGERSDYVPRLLTAFYPQLNQTLYTALANNASGDRPYAQFRSVHVLRRRASVFGYNAPTVLFEERPKPRGDVITRRPGARQAVVVAQPPVPAFVDEADNVLYLDTADEAITTGSLVVTQSSEGVRVAHVLEAETAPRTAYGIGARTTRLTLSAAWGRFEHKQDPSEQPTPEEDEAEAMRVMIANLRGLRRTAVLAGSEELTLSQRIVDRPIGKTAVPDPTGAESETRIELDGVVDGLTAGRWIIVSGERVDTRGTSGVVSAELAMIDNVEQQTQANAGGTAYSVLVLAPAGLAYEYKRDTVKILGNVVKATNGETRAEILGAGDAAKPLQTFALHQSPLTFVAAPTVAGVVSTLAIRVNDVLWHETGSLAGALPSDRIFVTRTGDDGKVLVIFGTGREGARLPTGADNVRCVYRSGIGRAGNVRAGQVATAISRPYGVRDVVNPLAASGGADPESRDDARRNIPVSLQAMGRVVSVRDYADFARTFAGIAKADAVTLSDGRRSVVHLTIGGTGDIEIDVNSDLYRNLVEALRAHGDPYQPVVVALREKIVIAGAARVSVAADYLWTDVAPRVRAALIDTFSYDRRDFGEPVYPAAVVSTIQRVPGVSYVDLDALGGIESTDLVRFDEPAPDAPDAPVAPGGRQAPKAPPDGPRLPRITDVKAILPRRARREQDALHPAQIAYLPPELADLFVLTEIVNG